jgi:hypothetical protein
VQADVVPAEARLVDLAKESEGERRRRMAA